jgi:hypothetical protein
MHGIADIGVQRGAREWGALGSLLQRAASGATLFFGVAVLAKSLLFGLVGVNGGPLDGVTAKGIGNMIT